MSLEKIYEVAKKDLDNIEQRFPTFWNNLNADDVVVILRIVSEQFAAVHDLVRENEGIDQEKLFSQEQMQNIIGLFQELTNNFFPMAHTTEPVFGLRILNDRELNKLWRFQKNDIEVFDQKLKSVQFAADQLNTRFIEMNNADESMINFLRSLRFVLEEMNGQFRDVKRSNELMWRHLNP